MFNPRTKLTRALILLGFAINLASLTAQNQPTDTIRIAGSLPISISNNAEWIKRFDGDIKNIVAAKAKLKDTSCDVLMLGSSSIRMWETASQDLAPMTVINCAYGGANIRDMFHNYDIIVRGYKPKTIVLYTENDLSNDPNDLPIGDIYDLFRLFTQRLQSDYPGVPIYILSLKPSPSRCTVLAKQKIVNNMLEDYCLHAQGVHYIDITQDMYNADKELRADIFDEDFLHMNAEGYKIWTAKVKPNLLENFMR